MQIALSVDRLMFGNGLEAKKVCDVFKNAEFDEPPLLPAYLAAVPSFTLIPVTALISVPQPAILICFLLALSIGFAVSITLLQVFEDVEMLKSRKVRFLHRATRFVYPFDKGEKEHLRTINCLKARVRQRQKFLFIWLLFLCEISSSAWRSNDFWSGLWQALWHQDIYHYHFTTTPDLLAVLALFGLLMLWLVRVTVPWYWLRQLEISVRELRVSR